MGTWLIAFEAAAAAAGALQAYQQGRLARRVAQARAQYARLSADSAEQAGAIAATRHAGRVRQQIGEIAAITAGAGVDLATGTPERIHYRAVVTGEEEIADVRYQAAVQAWGLRETAGREEARGAASSRAGVLGAASSLLQGAGRVADFGITNLNWGKN